MFNLFKRKKKPDGSPKVTLTFSWEAGARKERKSQVLLKEATARKKAGDLDGAIELLREACAEIEESGEQWGIQPFLRLPMYLQAAGRNDEAWRELNLLILRGYPGQIKDANVVMMEHSIVYDKMRLFLQREKKAKAAVKFGVLSYLSWATGLYMQERTEELRDYISRGKVEATIRNLLKKAKKEDLLEQIYDIVEEETEQLPHVDFSRISEKVDKAVTDRS